MKSIWLAGPLPLEEEESLLLNQSLQVAPLNENVEALEPNLSSIQVTQRELPP